MQAAGHERSQRVISRRLQILPLSCCRGGQEVKAEIAPWEAKMAEQEGRRGVAASERDLLAQKHEAAQQRRQVSCCGSLAPDRATQDCILRACRKALLDC